MQYSIGMVTVSGECIFLFNFRVRSTVIATAEANVSYANYDYYITACCMTLLYEAYVS